MNARVAGGHSVAKRKLKRQPCEERRGIMSRWKSFIATAMMTFGMIGVIYASVLRPVIQAEIDSKVDSVKESIAFMRCQIRAMMTPEQRQQADIFYEEDLKARGGGKK